MKTDDVEIKESLIQGLGVFATRDFKKGEVVLKWDISNQISKEEFELKSIEEKMYIEILNGTYTLMKEPECRANRSCNPNCKIDNFCEIAIRDIKKGEEITTTYGLTWDECNCEICRKNN